MYPEDYKYAESHEWVKIENGIAKIGITSYAIEQLTDLTYLEFQIEKGENISKGDTFGIIESVKTNSDLYAPISGEIIECNEELPDLLDELADDPHEAGWMLKIRPSDESELESLMNQAKYTQGLE
jgi:glycine cleavage system H protein